MKLDELTAKPMSTLRAWLPYVLVGALLVLSRTVPEIGAFMKSVVLLFPNILGETGVNADFMPLYLPGGILVLVVLATFFLHGMKVRELGAALGESSKVLLGAGFVLLFTVPMVRILINSGVNGAELASMPITMARFVADSVGGIYPLLARPSVRWALHRRLQHGEQHDAQPVPVRRRHQPGRFQCDDRRRPGSRRRRG